MYTGNRTQKLEMNAQDQLENIQATRGHRTKQRSRKLGQGLNKKGQIQTACNKGSKVRYTKGQCQRQRIQNRVKGQIGKSKFSNMLISRLDRIDTKGIRQRLLWLQIKEVYYQKQRSHARYDLQNRGRVLSPCFSLSSLPWQSLSKS